MLFDILLEHFESEKNISDILISENEDLVIRKNGDIQVLEQLIDTKQVDQIITEICAQNALTRDNKNELDIGYYSAGGFTYRINLFYKLGKRALAIRKITNQALELEDIMTAGLAKTIISSVLNKQSGLFLVTGTAWSGKSTTLMACLEYLNTHFSKHIITVEDPIEFVYKNKKSIFSQRQIERDTQTFSSGLKSLLRQNPDIVLVGEIRDPESAEAVINIAETGHLVLSTLHTKAAINTVSRLVSFFPPYYQDSIRDRLADVFLGSLAQNLIKLPEDIVKNDLNSRILASNFGRVATYELLINNTAVSNAIRKGDFKQIPSFIQTGKADGMIEMGEYKKLIWL
jgi:twitching motility protein PilT